MALDSPSFAARVHVLGAQFGERLKNEVMHTAVKPPITKAAYSRMEPNLRLVTATMRLRFKKNICK